MTYNQRLMKIVYRWRKFLSPEDGDYFRNEGILKDIALFSALLKANKITIEDDKELETALCNYLQVLMVLCMFSEDYRDRELMNNFFHVPIKLEDIMLGRYSGRDYRYLQHKWKNWHDNRLVELYNKGVADTLKMLGSCPPEHREMVLDILSYYSTPVCAFFCILAAPADEKWFLRELRILLEYVMDTHFPERKSDDERVDQYIEGMIIITKAE